jgi:short-subunit dehydrogenase
LLAYSDSLRAELFDWPNINVITVQPGYIDVAKVARVLDNHGKPTASAADENIPKKHADAFSPNYVGLKIMKAIVDGGDQEILIVTFVQRLGIWIRFFFPRLFFSFMKLRAKRSIQNNFHY